MVRRLWTISLLCTFMKKLDAYILKFFMKTFFFSLFLFAVITIAVDASEKAEDFIRSGLGISDIAGKYYLGFLPHMISLLFPVFVLIAVVFFTSRLAARSEVVAILSTGVSLRRFLFPYWVGGIFLALLLGVSNHFLVPVANKIRTDFEERYIDMGAINNPSAQYINNLHLRVDTFTYAGFRSFDTSSKVGQGFFLEKIRDNKVYYNLRSEMITWDTAKKQWRLENGIERTINGMNETVKKVDTTYLNIGYKPIDLAYDDHLKDKLRTPRLARFIKQEEMRGSETVNELKFERYRRDAYAISVIVMTMIAAILASRKVRGGSGLHLALAFIIGVTFIVFDKFSMVFSTKGNFPPVIAAWLPCVLFAGLAFWLYKRAPK
ncbi:LptF/LptG family permease [Lacibacter sp. MH-610]|uniref:LptF/LptG family permease n=1 Tax=Lacibacter sp. MH-610 TaxID=3020883 RepID=UPI003892186E